MGQQYDRVDPRTNVLWLSCEQPQLSGTIEFHENRHHVRSCVEAKVKTDLEQRVEGKQHKIQLSLGTMYKDVKPRGDVDDG
jgi:hypothetical protein